MTERLVLFCLVLIASTLPSTAAQADNSSFLERGIQPGDPPSGLAPSIYLVPNERYPEMATPIWKKAVPGLYVSVGTERGFIGAANIPEAQGLLLIDQDRSAVYYNEILIALLQATQLESRKDFIHLRLHATVTEWQARAHGPYVSNRSAAILKSDRAWSWWKKIAREFNRPTWKYFYQDVMGTDPGNKGQSSEGFKKTVYFLDDIPFRRIEKLAKQGLITPIQFNLNDPFAANRILDHARKMGAPLSVIDLSNAIQPGFIRPNNLEALLQALFLPNSSESLIHGPAQSNKRVTILLATLPVWASGNGNGFPYRGFRGSYIQDWGSISSFVELLPKFFYNHPDRSLFFEKLPAGLQPGRSCIQSVAFLQFAI